MSTVKKRLRSWADCTNLEEYYRFMRQDNGINLSNILHNQRMAAYERCKKNTTIDAYKNRGKR